VKHPHRWLKFQIVPIVVALLFLDLNRMLEFINTHMQAVYCVLIASFCVVVI